MSLFISGRGLVYSEFSSKHSKLYQGLDQIVYLRLWFDFDYIEVILKISIPV